MATQKDRPMAVITPLGEDALLLRGLTGREVLGRPYEYELDLLSENGSINMDEVLGQRATIRLELADGKNRFFDGFVSRITQTGGTLNHVTYQATVRPWLWFLTRRADCRIFQEMTVPEIIKKVFQDDGFTDFEDALDATYGPWTYCVQYRETDFNFVSRLMEHEGIYYYFKQENGKHTLVLADSYNSHGPLVDYEEVMFHSFSEKVREEYIYDWNLAREVVPGTYTLQDFDFEKPSADLSARAQVQRKHANAAFEVYDYPGEYVEDKDAKNYVKTRIDELQCQHEQVAGAGTVRGFYPGGLFSLIDHPRDDQNREYLVVSAIHELHSNEFEVGGSAAEGSVCTCRFSAIDSKTPFRSQRVTPKPVIQGPQTAIVVGPSGDEIYTDKYGRVKVQFHWDRQGKRDENSSCWIRVAQVWAGAGWGGIQIPRIGQEVMIEFLEGDPDQPLVTGRIYNAEQMPPYELPVKDTQSGIKSRTTKGGNSSNFNELRFEDKKGSEEVYIHAEKNWTVHVKDAEAETVGSSISTNAGGSISRSAGADHSRTADQNIKDKAGQNITTDSGKNMNLTAGGSYELYTNLGIQLKAMNFMAAAIESGAKKAAEAVKKGAAGAAVAAGAAGHSASSAAGGGTDSLAAGFGAVGEQAAKSGQETGQQALAALSPAIEAGAAELGRMSNEASKGMQDLSKPTGKAIAKMDALKTAVESGASPEVLAGAVLAAADAAAEAWKGAAAVLESMLPKIPSITLWAMKDIKQTALWGVDVTAEVRDINIQTKNKNISVTAKKVLNLEAKDNDLNAKAKQNVSIEATEKNLNILAKTKDVLITGKEKVNIKAEDKDLVIEAGKTRVIVKAAKQMVFKCGSASIAMKEGGDILIKGGKITLKGTEAIEAKGNPIKLN